MLFPRIEVELGRIADALEALLRLQTGGTTALPESEQPTEDEYVGYTDDEQLAVLEAERERREAATLGRRRR